MCRKILFKQISFYYLIVIDFRSIFENAEDALYDIPEHIKAMSKTKKSEDMLSNQMLSGIPEVDLGIE